MAGRGALYLIDSLDGLVRVGDRVSVPLAAGGTRLTRIVGVESTSGRSEHHIALLFEGVAAGDLQLGGEVSSTGSAHPG